VKVVVVGAGAVGSLFGARLFAAGHSVALVGRPDHVAAIREHGLRVRNGTEEVFRVPARTELSAGEGADAVLLTVKTFDLPSASAALARAFRRPAPILLPQNGLNVESLARPALAAGGWLRPADWTVRAVHSVPVTWVAPGVVREAGTGEILLPDPEMVGPLRARVECFLGLFRDAGFSVRTVRDFEREVWRKALVNAAINPVSAARSVPNGRLLEGTERMEALRLLREALSVARAAGFDFSEEEAVRDFERVARSTAQNRSSMLQDLDRGRPTEIEAISGEILRIGAVHGLDLPATRAIVEEIRRRSADARARPQPS
jgi:2-dehydropantoate 2-reductase